ncbi:MAG: SLC13 family permease [Deltaproteobacteria bacterium]|nr:SLC13 family permease [Deltaproteobacteria bacterium]
MGAQAWITLGVTVLTIAALVRQWAAPEVALLGAVTALMLLGVLTPGEALGAFGSDALLSVAALFVVAAAVRRTGILGIAADYLFGRDSGREPLLRVMLPTAGISAFLNNTPIVAMFTPAVIDWCKRHDVSPSRMLMPMCYAVSLGGMCTLVGTSSTLVVDGLMRKQGLAGIGMFEITPLAVPVTVGGVLVMWLLSRALLADRRDPVASLTTERRNYLVEMLVNEGSPIVGLSIAEAGLRQLPGLFLMNIEREGRFIGPVGPNERLSAADRLVFTGVAATVADLRRFVGLSPAPEAHYDPTAAGRRNRLYEVVISASSPIVGITIKDASFRRRYDAAVIAAHRSGQRLPMKLGEIELKAGDTLMLEAAAGFYDAWVNSTDFSLISRVRSEPPPEPRKAARAILVVSGMVLAVAFGWVPMVVASFVAAGLLLALGVLTPREASRSVDLPILAVIAGSIGLGEALQKTGAAAEIASRIVGLAGQHGPVAILAATFVCTLLVTQFITNSAAAGLMFPIVVATADSASLDPRPFALVLAVATASSFLTPIGYQTNLMISGPGGYRFADFTKLGVPVSLAVMGITVFVAQWLWPL